MKKTRLYFDRDRAQQWSMFQKAHAAKAESKLIELLTGLRTRFNLGSCGESGIRNQGDGRLEAELNDAWNCHDRFEIKVE